MKIIYQQNLNIENKFNAQARGFTLIETLVALFIFSIALVVFMNVMSRNLNDTIPARDRIVATYLAYEGVEWVRNIRDTYVLYNDPLPNGWNDFLVKMSNCDQSSHPDGCYIDLDQKGANQPTPYNVFNPGMPSPITSVLVASCNGKCPRLKYSDSVQAYGYIKGEPTSFIRTIRTKNVDSGGPNHEVLVTSTVTWGAGLATETVSFSEYLFNRSGQ